MKLNFYIKLKDLEEKEVGEFISILFANSIASGQSDDPIKMYELAKKIYNSTSEIEIDKSDIQKLKDVAKSSKSFSDLGRAQILDILNSAK